MQPKLYTCCKLAALFAISFLSYRNYAQLCTAPALAGGTASSSNTYVCPTTGTLITVVGSTAGSGLTYQWETSTDSLAWSNLSGSVLSSLYAFQTNLFYRRKIMCSSGGFAYSSGIKINEKLFTSCYCQPANANCNTGYSITNVNYGSLNNASTCGTNGYSNFTSTVAATAIMQGTWQPITVTVNTGSLSRYVHCYIDYDHNGVLSDKEYTVFTVSSGNVYTGFIRIPFFAKTGITTMRLTFNGLSAMTAFALCTTTNTTAETEDYSINITPNTTAITGHVIYVKQTAAGSDSTGRSWANALTSVRKAISMAFTGDTIKVAKGIYYTGVGYINGFTLQDSLVLLGGYPNTGSPMDADRSISTNTIILSGYQASGSTAANYHVLYAGGTMPSCIVDGFVLQNGGSNTNNVAQARGGGISAENGANPVFKNCIIRNNYLYARGTAIAVFQAAPVFRNCIIEKNKGYHQNILIENDSKPVFYNSLIADNEGTSLMHIDSSTVLFSNSTIAGNTLSFYTMMVVNQSQIRFDNSISFYNAVYSAGYRYLTYDSSDVMLSASAASFNNTLTQVYNQGTSFLPGYHPKFRDTASIAGADGLYFTQDDGFTLVNPCSPAINAGANTLAATSVTDITGSTRIFEGQVDLGAYELQQNKTATPATVYVNASATGLNNGTSWSNAFTDLHKALQTCSDTIKMAAGTYAPFQAPANDAYWLDNKRIILGAYPAAGNPTNNDRNINLYPTLISGATTTTAKAGMVMKGYHLDSTFLLDGITFTNAGNTETSLRLAGLYFLNCNNPVVSNCTFTGNYDLLYLGVNTVNPLFFKCSFSGNTFPSSSTLTTELLAIENSISTTFKNCSFQNNSLPLYTSIVGDFGKIINSYKSKPVFDSCTFARNKANVLYNLYSDITINNSHFLNNYAAEWPADLYNIGCNPVITGTTFRDSAAGIYTALKGGTMRNNISNPVFTDCRFYTGKANLGGVAYNDSSVAKFTKCVFSNCMNPFYNLNSSHLVLNNCIGVGSNGTFIANVGSNTAIANCAIVNGSSSAQGVINNYLSSAEINNSIFWKNYQTANVDSAFLNNRADIKSTGPDVIRNSMFEFFDAGSANSNIKQTDPRFINLANPIGPDSLWFTADDGLRLCDCSPAINSGSNAFAVGNVDISGLLRPFGPAIDRGAYELQSTPPTGLSSVFYVHAAANGSNNGRTWGNAYTNLQSAINNPCADTIKIAAGIYKPAVQNRDSLFTISRGMVLLGSYNAADPNATRAVDNNPTILSGDIGIANDTADNSFGLMKAYNVDTLQIDGIVFRDVNRNMLTGSNPTLALYAHYVQNLDISNTRFYSNMSKHYGGTVYLNMVKKINIRRTVFSKNKVVNAAGIAFSINGYSKRVTDCIFDKNETTQFGGAIYCSEAGVAFTNCLFNGNTALFGAGMYLGGNPDMSVINCTFSNNRIFSGNSPYGAGIYSSSSVTFSGSLGPHIQNCIFTGNGFVGDGSQYSYMDIFYDKNGSMPSNNRVDLRINHSATTTLPISFSGGGNIGSGAINYKNAANAIGPDNKWFTADDGLGPNICSSGGIDAGLNSSNTNPADLSGRARIYNNTIDMGAYEFNGTPEGAKLLNTANDSLVANKEITDADGWTHYYKDCFYLMSLQKRGQNIGTVGNGSFSVKIKTTPAYGSGSATNLSAATYLGPCVVSWQTMNRYWTVTPTNQPTDSIQVRFPYTYTDFNDVRGSNPSITTPQQMVFYNTDGTYSPTGVNIPASSFHKYSNAINPSTTRWVHTLGDSALQASYFVKNFGGGGGGAYTLNTPTNTWLGITPDWNLASNWSVGQVPLVCSRVVVNTGVPLMPVITSPNSTCYGLTLTNGATITVSAGGNLTIVGNE